MKIKEKNPGKTDGIPGQMYEKNAVATLFEEMQIAFPDKVSQDIYHNAIQDYYELLNTILRQFA